jgi:glycosyltransferase involved in cell wall biosynthesis
VGRQATHRDTVDVVLPVYHGNLEILAESVSVLHRALLGLAEAYRPALVVSINGPGIERIESMARRLADAYPLVRVFTTQHAGKGWGVFSAWAASEAEIVSYMDVDLATDLEALPALLEAVRDGADFAIGSRYREGARMERTLKRLFLSKVYHRVLINGFLGVPLTDVQCGFKACRRPAALALIPKVKDRKWFFEAEMLYYAYKAGYRIEEIPVVWRESSKSSLHLLQASLEFFHGVMRLKLSGSRAGRGSRLGCGSA